MCTVEVLVDDVNDNPPRFLKSFYKINVNEATAVGSEILQVLFY